MVHFDSIYILCILEWLFQIFVCTKIDRTEIPMNKIFQPENITVSTDKTSFSSGHSYFRQKLQFTSLEVDEKNYHLELVCRNRSVFEFGTPVWLIGSIHGQRINYSYKTVDQKSIIFDGIFFEDEAIMATLLAYDDKVSQQTLHDGVLGLGTETQRIKSVAGSTSWSGLNRSDIRTYDKNKDLHLATITEYAPKSHPLHDTREELKNNLPTLYIKILPVIDFELFKLLKKDIKETVKYVAIFWNAVDLRFSKLKAAKIEIKVTGIIIATDERALKFIDQSREELDFRKVYPFELLEKARWYFYENFIEDTKFNNYDSAFVMTALNTKPQAGMSYIGRICNRLYSTAFIRDNANFQGLHSATHELGHLLNFFHDESDQAKDCGRNCDEDETTVMAPFVTTTKSFVWSSSSQKSLKEFITTKAAYCLRSPGRIN